MDTAPIKSATHHAVLRSDTRQRNGHTKVDNGKSGRGLKEEKFVSTATKINLKKNKHEARIRGMRRETMAERESEPHGTRGPDGGDSENKANASDMRTVEFV
jgi:hypothetical protein